MSRNFLCVVVAMVALTAAGTAQAALVAYDGFSTSTYTPGSELLNGTNGGTGWSGPFTSADSVNTSQYAYLTEQSTGLTYGNLVTTPGSAVIGTGQVYTGDRYCAPAQSSGTLYMSMLVQLSSYSASGNPINFNLAQSNGGSNNYLAGINAQWASNYWRIFERSGSSTNYLTASTVTPTANVTHLLVEKITFDTSSTLDTVSIFIDPALGTEPAATVPAACITLARRTISIG